MIADCEEFEEGEREMKPEDMRAFWSVPELDLATSSLMIFADDRLAAETEVAREYASMDIHPDFRGRGLGSALLPWTWERARAQGARRVGQSVSDRRTDAPPLLRAHGYEPIFVNWLLRMPIAGMHEPAVPEGYELRTLDYARDGREVFAVIDAAFREFQGDRTDTWENWDGFIGSHEKLAPWASLLAIRDGRIVGTVVAFDYGPANDAWIQQLAVDAGHRRRGLGTALVRASFARFAAKGYETGGLGTDSRGSSLSLYEGIGLQVRTSSTYWEKDLTRS
jgi:GNAT superfamily N-acetyltransferase